MFVFFLTIIGIAVGFPPLPFIAVVDIIERAKK